MEAQRPQVDVEKVASDVEPNHKGTTSDAEQAISKLADARTWSLKYLCI